MSHIYGLILAGGKSSRMLRDKALLAYHGQNQVQRSASLLSQVCDRVFLSLRPGQSPSAYGIEIDVVHDRFGDAGPLGGILSAQVLQPDAAWLAVACDLPFLSLKTLDHLVKHRAKQAIATAFASHHDGLPEPLCALYEPASHPVLARYLKTGRNCPRKILIEEKVPLLALPDPAALDNVNTTAEYQEAMERLRNHKPASSCHAPEGN
jgi:molybdenum cofactor guanylyltransferase